MANKRFGILTLAIALLVLTLWGCDRSEKNTSARVYAEASSSTFAYPKSKIWAHGVYGIEMGRQTEDRFDGMEVDLVYSEYQDRLLIGHDLCDTVYDLSLDTWLDSLNHPESDYFWLDMKNLTPENASRISHHICQVGREHHILQRMMVESQDHQALKTVKDSGLYVILWVDNIWWSGHSEEEWFENTCRQIEELHPDALSGNYHNFPRLPEAFPNQHIHIWDTPRAYNDTNVAHSQMIASHPSVKVVLVDYPEPIDSDEND